MINILIVPRKEAVMARQKNAVLPKGPHVLTREHLRQIQAVDKRINVMVCRKEDVEKYIGDADIIAGNPATIPDITHAKNLKWVHSFSAGMDQVLTAEVAKSDILLSNSSGIHKTPIAEYVLCVMLMFAKQFVRAIKNQERRAWQRDETLTELKEKTVLVVGLGNIGGEVARLASCFGAHVCAVTRSTREQVQGIEQMYKPSDLMRVLPKADFVVSCLPHTKKTHHLFDMGKFKAMKPSAIFINIGRGGLVNEKDLIMALRKKLIAGAGLDVTEIEPLPASSPLWTMPHVIITPHHSGLSEKYMDRAIERFCLNLKAFLKHKPLPNLVDKKLGY